jgi:hypothetical protein
MSSNLYIQFESSDGDNSTWPSETRTTRVVDDEGYVDFYSIVDPEESRGVKWRTEVGAAVARQMNLPGACICHPLKLRSYNNTVLHTC